MQPISRRIIRSPACHLHPPEVNSEKKLRHRTRDNSTFSPRRYGVSPANKWQRATIKQYLYPSFKTRMRDFRMHPALAAIAAFFVSLNGALAEQTPDIKPWRAGDSIPVTCLNRTMYVYYSCANCVNRLLTILNRETGEHVRPSFQP